MALLAKFLRDLQEGSKAFRYFDKRPLEVIEAHEVTLLLKVGGKVVAYGHLELEDARVWLGIAVADDCVGCGWGTAMMDRLIRESASLPQNAVYLRVDKDNDSGIGLYQKIGFDIVEEEGEHNSLLMTKIVVTNNTGNNE